VRDHGFACGVLWFAEYEQRSALREGNHSHCSRWVAKRFRRASTLSSDRPLVSARARMRFVIASSSAVRLRTTRALQI
jgi:hypothetical protein